MYPDRRTIVSLALIEDYINSRHQAYRPQVVLDLYRRGSLLNVHAPATGFRRASFKVPDHLKKDQQTDEQYVPGGELGLMWHFIRVAGRALSKSRYSCLYAYEYFNPGAAFALNSPVDARVTVSPYEGRLARCLGTSNALEERQRRPTSPLGAPPRTTRSATQYHNRNPEGSRGSRYTPKHLQDTRRACPPRPAHSLRLHPHSTTSSGPPSEAPLCGRPTWLCPSQRVGIVPTAESESNANQPIPFIGVTSLHQSSVGSSHKFFFTRTRAGQWPAQV